MKKTNIDSPFYRTMGKIGDLLFANLLWLVCCLPILTAGASTLGLFTVVNKMAAKEDYTVRTDFFKAFKRDFKQSTALWLVLLLAGFAALTGLRTATAQDTPSTGILAAASFLLLVLAGGGVFAYVKFIKPKQGVKVSADPEDYDFEDEEMVNEDTEDNVND